VFSQRALSPGHRRSKLGIHRRETRYSRFLEKVPWSEGSLPYFSSRTRRVGMPLNQLNCTATSNQERPYHFVSREVMLLAARSSLFMRVGILSSYVVESIPILPARQVPPTVSEPRCGDSISNRTVLPLWRGAGVILCFSSTARGAPEFFKGLKSGHSQRYTGNSYPFGIHFGAKTNRDGFFL
jgi:hypothetical protein